jgi:hypothetical protein
MQALDEQIFPPVHLEPQVLQLLGSLNRSTHAPLHSLCPVGQDATWPLHTPNWQVSGSVFGLESSQDVPFGFSGLMQAFVQVL